MKEYNKPRQSNTLRPGLYGDDPLRWFLRGVFLANRLASNDESTKTTERQNTYQRKLTVHKNGPQ